MLQKKRKLFFSFILVCILLCAGISTGAFAADHTHTWGSWTADENNAGTHSRICSECRQTQTAECSFNDTVVAATCLKPGYTLHICKQCEYTYMDSTVDALGHNWQETEKQEATCTVDGFIKRTCANCKATATQVLSASHAYSVRKIQPTCTSDGCDRYECINCDNYYTQNIVPALGHTWQAYLPDEDNRHTRTCSTCHVSETENCKFDSVVIPPDCLTGGYTDNICTICNQRVANNYTDPLGHAWDEGKVILEATCAVSGKKLCTCIRCDATNEEEIPATGKHERVDVAAVEPTCTETGKSASAYCKRCNTVLEEEKIIAAKGHTFKEWTTITPASCGDGLKESFCADCNFRTTETLKGDGKHEIQVLEEVPATCTEDGLTTGAKCTLCDTVLYAQQTVPALGHDWQEEWITPVTCESDGVRNKSCSRCEEKEENETVKATGHNFVSSPSVAATCTQQGMTVGIYCSNCLQVTKEQEIVEKLPHKYQVTEERKATCTVDGYRNTKCENCTATEHIVLEKLGHEIVENSRTEPQCERVGLIVRSCTRDGCKFTTKEEIPATGHNYISITVTPTCTDDGYTKYTCSACKNTYTADFNPATGHNGSFSQTMAPTCTSGGYDVYYCNTCKQNYHLNPTDATGHKWDSGQTFEPTCTENGYTKYTCTACKTVRTQTTQAAFGHSFINCTANGNGTHTGICKNCERNITEDCNGGTATCQKKAVCKHCKTEYGDGFGDHKFAISGNTATDHSTQCIYCGKQGETQPHTFLRETYDPTLKCCTYTCSDCEYSRYGRPMGDLDGDGQIQAADARLALRQAVGLQTNLNETDLAAADADKNGKIEAADARLILRKSVGLETKDMGFVALDENGNLTD